ncbi:hypothetical protein HL658_05155 [Azospirillum sp. RWY-5-1]|uniref:Uncharacterized protein n=1 Tax=Azospirillum oleiclasticum TaxID=2735135 RepID=A0ABX2T4G0_9PROT|nr:hypothetical protein [Azospirillum oleiclasticum]NYZ11929.1 hypothetical protein [Azospirillum oleiclasticum]NYZ19089.1 hypothetical protein [Azospirillum oleiclasticum]
MTDKPETNRAPTVPKPPSREDIERISEAQGMITDDWTGDGGRPASPDSPPGSSEKPK